MSDSNEIKPILGNEETKQSIDASKPDPFTKTVDVAPKAEKPIEVKPTEPEKEVKPVADKAKDPTGEFDYSKCKTYTVKDGQDLLDVANDVLVAYRQLRYFNHLPKNNPHVHAGQVIYIPNDAVVVPLDA